MTSCPSSAFHVQGLATTLWLNSVMCLSIVISCFQVNFILSSVVGHFVKTTDNFGSSSTCASFHSSVVSVRTRSVLECAQVCTTEADCVGFNSLPGWKTCDFFTTTPTLFVNNNGCTFYGVICSYLYVYIYYIAYGMNFLAYGPFTVKPIF